VNILRSGKRYERLCGDVLAVHEQKCTLGKLETFSHLASDENCHDSGAHGRERHGPFTQLVGICLG
jgi:hypothetical protein